MHLDVLARAARLAWVSEQRQLLGWRQCGGLRHRLLNLTVIPTHFYLVKGYQLINDVGTWLCLQSKVFGYDGIVGGRLEDIRA